METKERFTQPTKAKRHDIGNVSLQPAAGFVRYLYGVCMAIESILRSAEAILTGPTPVGAMERAVIVERRSARS